MPEMTARERKKFFVIHLSAISGTMMNNRASPIVSHGTFQRLFNVSIFELAIFEDAIPRWEIIGTSLIESN